MALVCASVRLFMDVRVIDYNGGAAIVNVSVPVGIVSNVLSAGSSLLTCLASFALEFRTLVVYRRMSKVFRYQHRDDYRLLFYALLGLIGQSLLAMYYVIIYSVGIAYPQINAAAQNAYPYINSLLALGDAICLFVTRLV
ncbi:hypothetical protein AAVH_17829 [Aphelenchoides avenae]|nr:hypothetical protein AAVH_17829 [Aphelenchus avenae]